MVLYNHLMLFFYQHGIIYHARIEKASRILQFLMFFILLTIVKVKARSFLPLCAFSMTIENNHLNLRKVLEKGTSFDDLTQQDIDLVVSHVNSIARKSLNDIPAITLFEAIYGKEVLQKLNVSIIPLQEVRLTPDLVK